MEITVDAQSENLCKLQNLCRELLDEKLVKTTRFSLLMVAVEEIFTNIVKHSYNGRGGAVVFSVTKLSETRLHCVFIDSGMQFDTVAFSSESYSKQRIEAMESGGMGIHIVKNTVENLRYKYEDEKNILSFEYDLRKKNDN